MDQADELTVIRCQLGERAAFDALVRRWHPHLRRYLRHLADDDADDVAQDVWLKVLRGLPRLRDPDRFAPWLFTIARRRVVDIRRAPSAVPVDVADADRVSPDTTPALVERLALDDAVAALRPYEREVVVLHHLADLPIADVAAIQQVPVGTVKSRLHRARRLLAAAHDPSDRSPR